MRSRPLLLDGCLAVALAAVVLSLTGLGVAALIALFVVVVCAISLIVEVVVRRGRRRRGSRRSRDGGAGA